MKEELKIYTLGRFELIYGGVNLTEETNKNSKYWKIFQYLITNRNRSISQEELITELNFQNNSDPEGSLFSAVYRLRKMLQKEIDPQAKNYIKRSGCAYTFNNQKNYWLDAEEFEHLCELTQESLDNNTNKWKESFEEALQLYQGDYLEEINTEEWIWNERDRYITLLTSTLRNLDEHLSQAKKFEQLRQFYSKVIGLIKFDYELIARLIEILLKLDKTELARKKYEEIIKLYQDKDLLIPVEIIKLGSKFFSQNCQNPELLFAEIKDKSETGGAYICTPETFTSIYDLETHRAKREALPRYTVHLRLKGELKEKEIAKLSDNLFEILSNQLRCSDILCRWNRNHLIILLTKADKPKAEKIIDRINNSFDFHYDIPEEIKLETKLEKV
ncbi:MAG: AfsR/SARP family transcriptional regulator [Bacillota bacterium]